MNETLNKAHSIGLKKKKKNSGMALTQLSLTLNYITVEEYFIIIITLIVNFNFLCFAVDELPVFIIIVYNF